jgi:hypothetical protein
LHGMQTSHEIMPVTPFLDEYSRRKTERNAS